MEAWNTLRLCGCNTALVADKPLLDGLPALAALVFCRPVFGGRDWRHTAIFSGGGIKVARLIALLEMIAETFSLFPIEAGLPRIGRPSLVGEAVVPILSARVDDAPTAGEKKDTADKSLVGCHDSTFLCSLSLTKRTLDIRDAAVGSVRPDSAIVLE
jgi:hypothetical protein